MRSAGVGCLALSLLVAACGESASTRNKKITRCANNLSQLYKMQFNYMVQHGGSFKYMPHETGGAFWLKLTKVTPPIIDSTLKDIYFCPYEKNKPYGETSYRGPKSDVNELRDDDVVGCCSGLHLDGSGNVLLKSGDVTTVTKTDSRLKRALQETTK